MESRSYWESEHGSIETFEEARNRGQKVANRLNATSVAELRALSADVVNAAGPWNENLDPGLTAFAPNIDNYVVPNEPAKVFDLAQTQQIPLLAGFNVGEQVLFLTSIVTQFTRKVQASSVRFIRKPNHQVPGAVSWLQRVPSQPICRSPDWRPRYSRADV